MATFSLAQRLAPRVVTATALFLGALLFTASPALGTQTLPIHDDHTPTTADEFSTQECEDFDPAPSDEEDGWHFVLPGNSASFTTLTLSFEDASGDEHVVVIDGDDTSEGYFVRGKHAYVITPAGWTLVDGSADVSGDPTKEFFNLSHTCPAEGGQSPSVSPSPSETLPPSPSVTPSLSPGVSVSPSQSETHPPSLSESPILTTSPGAPGATEGDGDNDQGGELPLTGASLGILLTVGAALLAGGTGLLLYTRKKKASTA